MPHGLHGIDSPVSAALLFAVLFVAMLVVTHLAIVYLGHKGVYTLAGIMGISDVDPFILGVTQSRGREAPRKPPPSPSLQPATTS